MTKNPSRPVPCSIEGCDKPKRVRGWCGMHYQRWSKHGDPTPPGFRDKTPKGALDAWVTRALESQTDECMPWPFAFNPKTGYGVMRYKGTHTSAHRVVLMLATSQDGTGLHASHAPGICHNRLCCNPRHLRWATPSENQADKVTDGTTYRGERHYSSKLTELDVLAIRADTRPHKTIAADYGVSQQTVKDTQAGLRWTWLGRETE